MLATLIWNFSSLAMLALPLAMVVVFAAIWFYAPQTRAMAWRWQWALPALRIAALLLLVVSLLKPAMLRSRRADEQGALLLLVDHSQSMGIADTEMPPAQQVALADALDLLPGGAREATGQRLQELLEAVRPQLAESLRLMGDVDYARLSGRGEAAAAKRLDEALDKATSTANNFKAAAEHLPLDAGLKHDLAGIAKRPDAKSRVGWARRGQEIATRVEKRLAELQADADRAKYEQNPAVKEACTQLVAHSRLQLAERALTMPDRGLLDRLPADVPLFGFSFGDKVQAMPLRAKQQSVRQLGLEATALESDVAGCVEAAAETVHGRSIQAAIVLSDGRQVGTTAMKQVRGVPVFTVLCGAENAVKDIAVESVMAPPAAFVGQTITVQAQVRSINLAAKGIAVTLKLGEAQQTRPVDLSPGSVVPVEFEVQLDTAGVQTLEVSVPELAAEASRSNNRASRQLVVHADKLHLLAITGHENLDYRYIRAALERSPWALLTERQIEPGRGLLLRPEEVRGQAVILLFNVPPKSLSAVQIGALHQAVNQGASLFLFAEDPALLEEYAQQALLSDLLPYQPAGRPTWRSSGSAASFHIAPSPAAEKEDYVRLADDAEESQRRWAAAPAVFHYLALPELKPNGVRPIWVERGSRSPVLTESRLGLGRVFFVGVDETWRWRQNAGEQAQDRLWLQLLRYAAEEPYTAEPAMRESAELANVSADPQTLRKLAESSGGEMLTLDRLAELPRKLARLREQMPASVEVSLWDSWLLYLLVFSLLGMEWAIRKRVGLP